MRTTFVIFVLLFGFFGNATAQRVEDGMTQSQLKNLFPAYSKMFDDTDLLVSLDTSDHFYFHRVKGDAEFIFQFGRLKSFQWVYTNGKKPFTILTKNDRKKLSKVLKGIIADYGHFQSESTWGDLFWEMPHAYVTCGYHSRDFRFGVYDSAFAKMIFGPTPNRHDSTSEKR